MATMDDMALATKMGTGNDYGFAWIAIGTKAR